MSTLANQCLGQPHVQLRCLPFSQMEGLVSKEQNTSGFLVTFDLLFMSLKIVHHPFVALFVKEPCILPGQKSQCTEEKWLICEIQHCVLA